MVPHARAHVTVGPQLVFQPVKGKRRDPRLLEGAVDGPDRGDLTTGGLIILALILFAMAKQSRRKEWSKKSFTISGRPQRVIGTVAR
jgi:hypothetical protein